MADALEQGSAEWFALRAGKFTSSRFADLMARKSDGTPSDSRRRLIADVATERLTGLHVERYQTAAMRRGRRLEARAREAYEMRTGRLVDLEAFIPHPTLPNVGVSPDGLIENCGMVELKCPDAMAKHLDALRTGAHAAEYRWQIAGQLWCAELEWLDAVSFDPRYPPDLQLAITRVYPDAKAAAALERACVAAELEVTALLADIQRRQASA